MPNLLDEPPRMTDEADLTRLVQRAARGEPGAAEPLARAIHGELRELAAALLRGERSGHTLQATALVNEAWLRLQPRFGQDAPWADRRAFFGAAVQAMRRLLVDHARERGRQKRGGGQQRVPLELVVHGLQGEVLDADALLDLHAALAEFVQVDQRAAQVVELHVFAGLSQPEVARALDVSLGTVELDWRAARAWLRQRLEAGDGR